MTVKKITDILEIPETEIGKYSNSRILLVLIKNAFSQLNGFDGLIYDGRLKYKEENKSLDIKKSTGRLRQENFRFPQLSTIFRRENLDVNLENRSPFSTRKRYLANFGSIKDFTNVSTSGTNQSTSPEFQGIENNKKFDGGSLMLNAVISSYAAAGFFYKSGSTLNLAQVNSRQENIFDYMQKIGLSFENTQDVSRMLRESSSIDNVFTRFLKIKNANVPATDVSRVTKYLPAESDANASDIEFPYVPGHEIYTSLSFNNDPNLDFETLDSYINDFEDFKIRIKNDLDRLGMANNAILNFENNFYTNLNTTIRDSLLKIFPADILINDKFDRALSSPLSTKIDASMSADYLIMHMLSSFEYNSPQLRSLFIASYAGFLVKKGVREPIWDLSNKAISTVYYKTKEQFRFNFSESVEAEGKEWELTAINAVTNIFNIFLGKVLFKTDDEEFNYSSNKRRAVNVFRDRELAKLDAYITENFLDNRNPATSDGGNDFYISGFPMAPELENTFYNLTPALNILEISRGTPADDVANFIINSFFIEENILDKLYERLELELESNADLTSFFNSLNTNSKAVFNVYGTNTLANSNDSVPPRKTDGVGFSDPPRLQGRLALPFPEIDESTYAMAVFEHFAGIVQKSGLHTSLIGTNWFQKTVYDSEARKYGNTLDTLAGVGIVAGLTALAVGLANVGAAVVVTGTIAGTLGIGGGAALTIALASNPVGWIILAVVGAALLIAGIVRLIKSANEEEEKVTVKRSGGIIFAFNKATVFNLVSCFLDNVVTQTLYGKAYTPLFSGGNYLDTLLDPIQEVISEFNDIKDDFDALQSAIEESGADFADPVATAVLSDKFDSIQSKYSSELIFLSKIQAVTGYEHEEILKRIDNGTLGEDPEIVEKLKFVGFFPNFTYRTAALSAIEKPADRRKQQITKVTDTMNYLNAYVDKMKSIRTNLRNLFNLKILQSGTEIVRSTERAGDLGMTFLTKDKIQNDIYHYAQRFVNGRNSTLPAILKNAGSDSFKHVIKYFNQGDHGFLQDDKLGNQKSMFVGIPTGFLEKARHEAFKLTNDVSYLNSSLISINLYRRNLANPYEKTYPKIFLFDTSRYVLSDDVSNILSEQNFQLNFKDSDTLTQFIDAHQITRIKISDSNATTYTPINKLDSVFKVYTGQAYDNTADTNIITPDMQESVFRNLILDFYLKVYYRQMLGLDITEYSHGLDRLDDPDSTDAEKRSILTTFEEEILIAFGYTPGDLVLDSNVKQIAGVLKEIKNSVIFKSEAIQNQIIKPRIFERVFGIYFNERDFTISSQTNVNTRNTQQTPDTPVNSNQNQNPSPEENYDNNIIPNFTVPPVPTADSRIEIKTNSETIFNSQALSVFESDYTRSIEDGDGTSSFYSYYITLSLLKSPE